MLIKFDWLKSKKCCKKSSQGEGTRGFLYNLHQKHLAKNVAKWRYLMWGKMKHFYVIATKICFDAIAQKFFRVP